MGHATASTAVLTSRNGTNTRYDRPTTVADGLPAPGCMAADDRGGRFMAEAVPYMSQLYPAAMRLTRNHCDAEDLIQETFTRAYLKFHQYAPGTNLRAWLHRILATTFYSGYRTRCREVRQVLADDVCDATGFLCRLSQPSRSAEAEAIDNLADSGIMRALAELPECFKTAVFLADVHGFSCREIADMIGTPLGTVMSRLHRGRRMLRAKVRARSAA